METTEKPAVYDIITTRIIELLETGTVPWQKEWSDGGIPRNLISGRQYRGINLWLLSMMGFEHNLFLTFKQVNDLGGKVKKGEHGTMVVFWKRMDKASKNDEDEELEPEETENEKPKAMLRYYHVFNIAQCEGIPEDLIPEKIGRNNSPIEACEEIVNNMPNKPGIFHQEHLAFYNPLADYVNMPKMDSFINSAAYYGTLFHELIHSTGHKKRLDRKEISDVISSDIEPYSIEELTAEIGACYLKSIAGVNNDMENSAAYIQGWLKRLKSDKRFIIYACSQAQKAADYVLNIFPEEKLVNEEMTVESSEPF